jgi:hypothetical protein
MMNAAIKSRGGENAPIITRACSSFADRPSKVSQSRQPVFQSLTLRNLRVILWITAQRAIAITTRTMEDPATNPSAFLSLLSGARAKRISAQVQTNRRLKPAPAYAIAAYFHLLFRGKSLISPLG